MKKTISAILAAGLLTLPIEAKANPVEDFFQGIFGPSSAPRQQTYPTHARQGRHGRSERYATQDESLQGLSRERSFSAMTSFYGGGPRSFEPNTHTANGERFNQWGLTAAHRTLPMGTRLLVSYRGRSCVVRVNDRGPAAWTGRSLDLSRGAASRLGLIDAGSGRVDVTVLASR